MRILVHDFPGYAFPFQLSRWLAAQGHEVLHLFSTSIEAPRGRTDARPDDPPTLTIEAVNLGAALSKYDLPRRLLQERGYGRLLARRLDAFAPDAVISGNCSPGVQRALLRAAHRAGARFVYWLHDIYYFALERALASRLPRLGRPAVGVLRRMEMAALRDSDGVVAITEDFRPILARGGVAAERVHVIENWAPLAEATPPATRTWREEHGLEGRFLFLYSGTLGLKHNPALLAALARAFRDDPEVAVVVVTQGLGRDWLERAKASEGLRNLVLLDYQPAARVPEVIGAGDVLVAILEPYAGVLSVPSKVLTYLCSGRPILGAVPTSNLAARTVEGAGAGLVVPPEDEAGFAAAARRLRSDDDLRQRLGRAGRAYAEAAFDIDRIGQRMLAVLQGEGNGT
ncbi:glycosyltransferase family 4 protein [Ferruginivarius sediminum]|uniref:Glycosyltransferase WbuB n=1 Tax=Ferruginivarius sediminum TaxID=2661937 RepID=A0A369T9C5_9PROT|nr:glycosyltransferase family 4 protein [Ferruginivarius sediminum]RDD61472.1 glycosyltransferase WbuB [Ferruginivarius sediminum]